MPEATLVEEMRNLQLQTTLQYVEVPDDCARGIYRFRINSCPGRTMEDFLKTLIKEKTLSIDFPELPRVSEIADPLVVPPINTKKRKASSKSTKAKQKANERKDAKKKTHLKKKTRPEKSKKADKSEESDESEDSDTNQERIRWRDLPLFSMDRSELARLTPRGYIETYWASHDQKRPQRYAYAYDSSLFNDKIKKINLNNLSNPLMQTYEKFKMPGVNRTMVLVSGAHTSFYWHNEDLDLGSINYMHWGAIKLWVIVHRNSSDKFRNALIRDFAPTEIEPCKNPVKHKNYLTDLQWLDENNIEYSIVSTTYFEFFYP